MAQNRHWRLDRAPVGDDFAAALSLQEEPVPSPAGGEALIRTQFLSMDAGTRMWMTRREDGYQPPLPLGAKMTGLAIGRIVESRASGFAKGDLVRCFGQWADYSLVRPELSMLARIDEDVDARQHFGALGLNAWTAYAGIVELGAAKAGETVVVSAAAGATGLLAAQIAKRLGCRVIGIAGGAAKCSFLRRQGIADATIDYKAEDVDAALSRAGDVDLYFDNVGGTLLDAVLPNMALHGRVVVCGLIASYSSDNPAPGPRRFDQVLMRRLTIAGLFLPDFIARGDAFPAILRKWFDEGRLKMWFDETEGLENTLNAYSRLFSGGNIGKVIVRV